MAPGDKDMLQSAEGTSIQWKQGKDPTTKVHAPPSLQDCTAAHASALLLMCACCACFYPAPDRMLLCCS